MATEAADEVAIVFIFDTEILDQLEDKDDRRLTFIHQSLLEIDEKLKSLGSQLVVRIGNPINEIPKLAEELGADGVFTAHDFEPYALKRDAEVKRRLVSEGKTFTTCKDHIIRQKTEVMSQSGTPFRVFTPYSRAWKNALIPGRDLIDYKPDLSKLINTDDYQKDWSMETIGFVKNNLWLEAGEDAAHRRLEEFQKHIDQYGEMRDFPAVNGTSGLSVHLRFGTISIRECVRRALQRSTNGSEKWLMELIWRDFYQDILANFPHSVDSSFNPIYKDAEWPGSEEHYVAWEEGKTGYPIVDAAMRCFNATGWMHNRLRMIVASFLTKHLLVDYKRGEAYFARKLLDFDLASNNGGWQWAASTGCDAQPYFRIFNPYNQSEKFDTDGEFIRTWVPELASVKGKDIHHPGPMTAKMLGYPTPIVEHEFARNRCLEQFKAWNKKD